MIIGLIIGIFLGALIIYFVIFSNLEKMLDSWLQESLWEYEKNSRNYTGDSDILNNEK